MMLRFALALLWTLAIVAGCLLPSESLPDSTLWSFDKLVHLVIFGGFGLLWVQALNQPMRQRVVWVLIAGLIFAGATEFIQGLVPGRSSELLDAAADVGGLVLGIGLYLLWRSRRVMPA